MESQNNVNEANAPRAVKIYGARVHNLKNIDVEVPLGKLTAVAGVSGSGKSSLALGILYAEGSRRYLEALSAYTRRRMTQAAEARIDGIENIPPALALRQRPSVPGVRSTFGTMTELLNGLRLMYSRLGSHRCPNGHYLPPTSDVARDKGLKCPVCGAVFEAPSAESFSFNSGGACKTCGGVGVVRSVDESSLVPDESLTIDQGAVAPWNSLMWSLMTDVCRAMGVRTDVPFRELTPEEREIVFHGPAVKKHILYKSKNSDVAGELDFTYYNAVYTVENALSKVKDDQGMKRVEKFLKQGVCPDCGGSRLNEKARSTLLRGIDLAQATAMTLDSLVKWAAEVPAEMPEEMRPMAESIVAQFLNTAKRLEELGLGYLTLDRAGATLSTGERQRVQLARSVRSRTTGALYVLDEPSIGLHPANVEGLLGVVRDLVSHGNSVVMVDHDTRVLRAADWMIEMGPGAGAGGGRVVAEGTIKDIEDNPASLIGDFLAEREPAAARRRAARGDMFAKGRVALRTKPLHTVRALGLEIPKGRLTVVTGVSGSGKTTLVLESLVPALRARVAGEPLPAHVEELEAYGIKRVNLIDATPVGANVRSTVATYCGVLDDLRRLYAASPEAKKRRLKAGDFSYNTGSLRCQSCDGTGQITMDVQFLPDVEIVCPECGGGRYSEAAEEVKLGFGSADEISLPRLMALTVDQAREKLSGVRGAGDKLRTLSELGLGYLTLGEATPALSGGEAQRLKLASEMGRVQDDAVFVFDEPTIGLHPLDVRVLTGVLSRLIDNGATVVVIEHDLDMIANADYVIDMGPGGGEAGGRIVAAGTPEEVAAAPESLTGRYLAEALRPRGAK
ncbi:excinuclease ABC subunit UvrA [uncultured Cloacibacillus sp.]|uniref:excinuclease ABC subunit UvrA n=1 Tax=uncultured Cloacibacillus sp. TaxID=889794 RepID=UPI0025EB8562|nr:excinuclease ABC subunit UvrA [uncultured Cloacibacillus sp.]